MKNKQYGIQILSALAALLVGGLLAPTVINQNVAATDYNFQKAIEGVKTVDGLNKDVSFSPTDLVTAGLKYLMYAIGVISVVMIIIGGIRYATSGGSADKVKSAKNTILYACVGLAVALLALAIVTFVQNDVVGGLGGGAQ